MSVGWLIGRAVHRFVDQSVTKEWEVTLPCSYRSTCYIYWYISRVSGWIVLATATSINVLIAGELAVDLIIFISTGCSWKIVFFSNSLQPLPRLHRCKRPSKLSTQCECTVSPIGWPFFVQPIAAKCWRGRGGKLSRFLGKRTQYLMNNLYMRLRINKENQHKNRRQ